MIRHVIRYIAAPLLGLFVRPILAAAHEESSRADAAELNEAIAIGERNEARKVARRLAQGADRIRSECAKSDRMVVDLSAEVDRLREVERNGLADDEQHTQTAAALHSVTTERDQLRCRCDALTARASKAEGEAMGLQRDLANAAVRVRQLEERVASPLEELAPRVEGAPVEAKRCAWCLGPIGDAKYEAWDPEKDITHPLCHDHGSEWDPTEEAIIARVAARAASCPSRQVADPLAIACGKPDGCGAPVGQTCDSHKAYGATSGNPY